MEDGEESKAQIEQKLKWTTLQLYYISFLLYFQIVFFILPRNLVTNVLYWYLQRIRKKIYKSLIFINSDFSTSRFRTLEHKISNGKLIFFPMIAMFHKLTLFTEKANNNNSDRKNILCWNSEEWKTHAQTTLFVWVSYTPVFTVTEHV